MFDYRRVKKMNHAGAPVGELFGNDSKYQTWIIKKTRCNSSVIRRSGSWYGKAWYTQAKRAAGQLEHIDCQQFFLGVWFKTELFFISDLFLETCFFGVLPNKTMMFVVSWNWQIPSGNQKWQEYSCFCGYYIIILVFVETTIGLCHCHIWLKLTTIMWNLQEGPRMW